MHLTFLVTKPTIFCDLNQSMCVCVCVCACVFSEEAKQGVTNTLALPINKMLYIYLLCPHSRHQKSIDVVVHLLTISTLSTPKNYRCCCTSTYYVHTLKTKKLSMLLYIYVLCAHSQQPKMSVPI